MSAKITNGKITFGRTIKTGDYENKRIDVELSFTLPEDGDAEVSDYIGAVGEMAVKQLNDLLADKVPSGVKLTKEEKPAKAAKKLPAAVKEEKTKTDASVMEEDPLADRATPPFLKSEAKGAETVEEGIDDLLGDNGAKEITDKELTDATQKCQARAKNAPAIRTLLGSLGIKVPPGRIIDLPQEKRADYLKKLEDIKPLA